jgi:hypothetical protein
MNVDSKISDIREIRVSHLFLMDDIKIRKYRQHCTGDHNRAVTQETIVELVPGHRPPQGTKARPSLPTLRACCAKAKAWRCRRLRSSSRRVASRRLAAAPALELFAKLDI